MNFCKCVSYLSIGSFPLHVEPMQCPLPHLIVSFSVSTWLLMATIVCMLIIRQLLPQMALIDTAVHSFAVVVAGQERRITSQPQMSVHLQLVTSFRKCAVLCFSVYLSSFACQTVLYFITIEPHVTRFFLYI